MVRYDLNLFEVWKPIPGYKNYEVSSEGRVRSLGRWENLKSGGCRFRKGHYNPKYSTLLTGLSLKEVKKLYYEDNKEKQLEKTKNQISK